MDRYIIEWKIENLSHWCPEVHGECIQSPGFYYPCSYMELYSNKGRPGERLGVRFCGVNTFPFSGELTFYSSEGSLLYEQPVNGGWNETVLELPPGPKFEDVLTTQEDFITVRLHMEESLCYEKRMRTALNVFKLSLKIDPGWIGKMESDATKDVCYLQLSPNDDFDRMWLKICSKDNIVLFVITPPTESGCPFAVEVRVSLTDGTVHSCAKKDERVFRDNTPWTFGSLHKKELIGKGVSIFLCLKTKHLTKGPFYMNCSHDCVTIEPNNTLCFSDEKAPSAADPDISNKVLTKDSGSQTSADDTVQELSKELMFLFQDQDFSDITLTCDSISFPVHKNILSARSPVFKTMLSTGIKTEASEVDIGDLDPSTLSRFLTHLYTGAVDGELQAESALKLYYAADKYEVPSLKRECVHCLSATMSISNVCDILSLADRHRDAHLLSTAHDFLLKNFNDVLKSKEWESFMGKEPLLAVKTVTHLAAKNHDPK